MAVTFETTRARCANATRARAGAESMAQTARRPTDSRPSTGRPRVKSRSRTDARDDEWRLGTRLERAGDAGDAIDETYKTAFVDLAFHPYGRVASVVRV